MEAVGAVDGAVRATVRRLSSAVAVVAGLVVFSAKGAAEVGIQMSAVSEGLTGCGLAALGAEVLPSIASPVWAAMGAATADTDGCPTAFTADEASCP